MSDKVTGVFEPEAVEAMGRAFEMAVTKLANRDVQLRELIALKIVAAARSGERDSEALCEAAIRGAGSILLRSPFYRYAGALTKRLRRALPN